MAQPTTTFLVMLPFVTAATALIHKVLNRKEGESAKKLTGVLKRHFNPEHTNVVRDVDPQADPFRAAGADSIEFESGATPAAGEQKPVRWKQYRWTEYKSLSECTWSNLTWRFYENGLVVFHGEMSNGSSNIDLGDTQEYRIELRTEDGCLIGAWKAGFFVRRNNAVVNYTSHAEEDHPLLALHSDELADKHAGIWFHGGERSGQDT